MVRNSFCSPSIGHWIQGSLAIWLGNFVAQNRECEISSNNQLTILYLSDYSSLMLQCMYAPLFMISINNPSQAVKLVKCWITKPYGVTLFLISTFAKFYHCRCFCLSMSTIVVTYVCINISIANLSTLGVLPPKCVLTILTVKIWDPHTPSTKSSILVLRTVLNVLTLRFSVFQKPPSNIAVQTCSKIVGIG